MMRSTVVAVLVALVSVVLLSTASAQSAPDEQDGKAEARFRFDRGLSLYNASDFTGALSEFERAYSLTRHPMVRFNIGLVHAKLDDSVAAVEALEPLLTGEGALRGDSLARAKEAYELHLQRIGELTVETNVPGTIVRIDNVDVAKAPTPPLRVNVGRHMVSVAAPGYEPRRQPVMVAARAREHIALELSPLEHQYAQLAIETAMPDVSVLEGDVELGKTPFAASVAFKPGVHELVFRRAGYREERRTVDLHPASTGTLRVEMVIDPGAPELGTLKVGATEEQAIVFIDETPRMDARDGMRLPVGLHHMRVERSGFQPFSRDVVVQPVPSRVDAELFPTADYLADYVSAARLQRTLAWTSLGVGAAVAIGGGAFLIYNQGEKDDAEATFNRVAAEVEEGTGRCDDDECQFRVEQALDDLESARDRDLYGWLGVGIGGAFLGTAAVLFLTGDDPDRYDSDEGADVLGSLSVHITLTGARLRGRF